jgi:predicted DCC family thiol-disulfide oxidoreductase YuxK
MKDKMIIFDGDCGICTKLSQYAESKIKIDVSVIPFAATDPKELPHGINDELAMKTVIFVNNNKFYIRSRAVFEILKIMPALWKLLGFLFANKFFSFLFDPFYNLIAKNRAKISTWFGLDACKLNFADSQD